MTGTNLRQGNSDDEIDLVELVQNLWVQKWLIAAITSVVVIGALIYAFMCKRVYSSTVVLKPAPINAFGLIAGEAKKKQLESTASVISIGTNLANDVLAVVVKNFESAAIRNEFNDGLESPASYVVDIKRHWAKSPSKPKFFESVSISVSAMSAVEAKQYLDGLMAYVSKVSATQLNDYFNALNLSHKIQSSVLYRVEQSPAVNTEPVKPKKPLVVALGVVVGGILGVFIALIRLSVRKRTIKILGNNN